jgi:hypothetical protein
MGLKHLPLVNIVLFLLSIFTTITLGGKSLSGRLRCLGFWLRVAEDVDKFYHGVKAGAVIGIPH